MAVLNNYDWMLSLSILPDVGKHTVNYMMAKDSEEKIVR
jgi:hypothetical protein